MKVEIFDVEHGACALVTADTGARMLIDCGHNASTGWGPSTCMSRRGIETIDMLVVSNYDEDHMSGLPDLRNPYRVGRSTQIKALLRNKSISPENLEDLKKVDGMGHGIRELVQMMRDYTASPPTIDWGSLSYKAFWNYHPNDFNDTNNLSLVLFLHYHDLHMIFPGDLERAGWLKLLENPKFRQELMEVNVFVASHHGRESGCCEEVFQIAVPDIVIFSDSGIQHDTQETASWYRERCRGIRHNGKTRQVLTTRKDGAITLDAHPNEMFLFCGSRP